MKLDESNVLRKIKLRRFMRDFAGGNQKRFAELLGLQQSQISQMIGPKRTVSNKMWARALEALKVDDITIEAYCCIPPYGGKKRLNCHCSVMAVTKYQVLVAFVASANDDGLFYLGANEHLCPSTKGTCGFNL